MHGKAGGRRGRPLAQSVHGLKGLVNRAKLSNAAGYDAREVPRGPSNNRDDCL